MTNDRKNEFQSLAASIDAEFSEETLSRVNVFYDKTDLDECDEEEILDFMLAEVPSRSFSDYLRSYLRLRFGESDQKQLIDRLFTEHNAPHSFEPVTSKWKGTISRWLTQPAATRETVFLLGFGLGMDDQDVSAFLTLVLGEADFDFSKPDEAVYWYCFRNQLPYSAAEDLLQIASESGAEHRSNPGGPLSSERIFTRIPVTCKEAVQTGLDRRDLFIAYLRELHSGNLPNARETILHNTFEDLVDRTRETIAGRTRRPYETISLRDIERNLHPWVHYTRMGNLPDSKTSSLNDSFRGYRLSRQRIRGVLNGKKAFRRDDFLTLIFFLSSESGSESFREEADRVLLSCGFGTFHESDPYDAFLDLCLRGSSPLALYTDVTAASYPVEA